ncbi:hypothetical protein P872_21530 [Rhodonellum psychrophilum GCM71 = DSM 17998]|uniref:Glycosyl transferase family 1 domain-containing protein n=2 Tax=Rhodonellum TaxID=336827 RepID=U5BS07_9BACT|nr:MULTISPECIES: glycosyltransferase [Rhodonellum]ERM80688.1 hypothetical protein P872_21530 [Rhodonellum psychrophilum GCM71 = DSM 17998]SDZ06723.1 Glycosyltransferase involved in cell wall bisynthesis [Rhodonellum ikkaensis]
MKILCFIDSLGSGGAQRQLIELAIGFKESGNEVGILVYHDINFFKSDLEQAGISVKIIIEANYFKRIFLIRNFIRSYKPDVLLSFLEGVNFIATLSGFPFRSWKLVVGERSANPGILKNKKLRFYRFFHLFADYIVANSKANLNLVFQINPFINHKKCKVIYNSVRLSTYPIQLNNVESEIVNIVIAASYRDVKNLHGLILAIASMKSSDKRRLKINWFGDKNVNGNSNYFQNSIKLIKEFNLEEIIKLNDVTDNIQAEYYKADFVGLFSHYEGFPNTICEAMALGLPVLSSKISDIPFFIKEDINGFLCDSYSHNSINKMLLKAINSNIINRSEMGINNFILANKNFNRNSIIESYLKLFIN